MTRSLDWFRAARYGLMFHYLHPADAPHGFDVARFVSQVEETGAGYVLFTLGQNSGHYCAPNPVYDRFCGYVPGERCSTRDLPRELGEALAARDIRLMLYCPANAPADNEKSGRALGGETKNGDGYNWDATPTMVQRWSEVVSFWSNAYGSLVSGWWFDGWFAENGFFAPSDEQLSGAARAGNAASLVCLNRNVAYGIRRSSPHEDYFAGERDHFEETPNENADADGQWHVCSFMGSGWAERGTRYADEFFSNYVKTCVSRAGVVTIDMAIEKSGELDPAQLAQMQAVRAAVDGR